MKRILKVQNKWLGDGDIYYFATNYDGLNTVMAMSVSSLLTSNKKIAEPNYFLKSEDAWAFLKNK